MEPPPRVPRDRSERGSVSARSRSHKSAATSDSGASLLSNANLEIVLDLIDDYYQGAHPPPQHDHGFNGISTSGSADVAALLGNYSGGAATTGGPSGFANPSGSRAMVAPEAGDESSRVIARALVVATSDGKRLEELLRILGTVAATARRIPNVTAAWLACLDEELQDTKKQLIELLRELREIHQSLVTETRQGELTSKLASLASWQESVLGNPLIQRVRQHGGAPTGGGSGMQTAQHFLMQATAAPPVRAQPVQPASAHTAHTTRPAHK